MKNLEIINVCEDSYALYEFCLENEYTDLSYDEWLENGGDLQFFEGDPDMLKLDGEIGYFAKCGDKVFFYLGDVWDDSRARGILRDFFAGGSVHNWGYYSKFIPNKRFPDGCQNWDAWDDMQNAIAYRGGCGYCYNILPLAA